MSKLLAPPDLKVSCKIDVRVMPQMEFANVRTSKLVYILANVHQDQDNFWTRFSRFNNSQQSPDCLMVLEIILLSSYFSWCELSSYF